MDALFALLYYIHALVSLLGLITAASLLAIHKPWKLPKHIKETKQNDIPL
jgi:hypothetical protein